MKTIFSALIPIFALIALGGVLRARAWLDDAFWHPCEKLNYFCLFPALMFAQVSRVNVEALPVSALATALLGAVLLCGVLLYLWKGMCSQSGAVFSSVIQGSLRPNTYVGVAAAGLMFGSSGLALTSLCIAISIPLLNVASIVILMVHGGLGRPSLLDMLKALLRNPVILSVMAGLLYKALSLPHVPELFSTLDVLGAASLPLGLMAVGAGLDPGSLRQAGGAVALSSLVKLGLVPMATALIAAHVGLAGPAFVVAVLFSAAPCTPSAYIMSKLLGGDHRLAASIISAQTVLALATMPAMMLWAAGLAHG